MNRGRRRQEAAFDVVRRAGPLALLLFVAGFLSWPVPGAANDNTDADEIVYESAEQKEKEAADRFDVDLFAPSGPAFIAHGDSPRQAAEPGVLQDFSFDVGTLSHGEKARVAVAFSTLPYWWGERRETLQEYRTDTSRLERIWARTQVSVGVARAGTKNHEALRAALAAQSQLLDGQDHRFDEESYRCIHNAWQTYRAGEHKSLTDTLIDTLSDDLNNLDDKDLQEMQLEGLKATDDSAYLNARAGCRDDAVRRILARPSWLVGAGVGMRSEEENLGSFDYDGVSLWTTYRQPLDSRGRFAAFGFLRGDVGRIFDFDNDLWAEGDGISVGLGGAYQTPRLRVDLSAAQVHRQFSDSLFDNDDFQQVEGVVDVRLREGFWIEASGGTTLSSDYIDGAFGSVTLKVAWGDYLPFLGGR